MKIFRIQFLYDIGLFFLILTLFLISFPRSWSLYPLGIFLFVGIMLWIKNFKTNWESFILNWYLIFPPVLFFLVQFINSIINVSPIILLENRLMFILIPLFGFPLFSSDYIKSNLRRIMIAFIFGIVLITVFIVFRLIYIVLLQHGNLSVFDYFMTNLPSFLSDGFSIIEHPTYLSLKIIWIFILIYLIPNELRLVKSIKTIILIFLSLCIFLLSSKAGMIAWIIISSFFLLSFFTDRGSNLLLTLFTIILFAIVTLVFINKNDRVKPYLNQVKSNLNVEKIDWKNIDQRTREWYTAFNLIKEKPLIGYGIGKIQEKMVESYNEQGFMLEAEMKVNAHNQFLESQVTFGIFGTFSLLWMLLTPLIFRNQFRYVKLATAYVLLMSYFLFIESMFNRQWGIMFFLLFYYILATYKKKNNNTIYNTNQCESVQ